MAPIAGAHHHRNTTKSSHKPYKSRHASKNALKEKSKGKVEQSERGQRRTPHQQVMSKFDRRNQARQKQNAKRLEHTKATSIFSGKDGAPRLVAVIPLCEGLDAAAAVKSLNSSIDIESDVPAAGLLQVSVDRFKQKIEYIVAKKDILSALDAARAADFIVFLLSPENEVDEMGELMLRSIEGQGVSNVLTAVQGIEKIDPPKRRPQVIASLKSFITHFFPTQDKVHSLDSRQDCANVIRSLCTTTPKGIRWRDERSWLLAEEVRWPGEATEPDQVGEVVIRGHVRGKGLKADRIVQVGDWGDFQIEKIVEVPTEARKKSSRTDEMAVDDEGKEKIVDQPTEDQDDLNELAPEEVHMDDTDEMMNEPIQDRKGVLLDEHHYFSDGDEDDEKVPKRLPKGTSKYQSAWYLGDVSDSGSDLEDIDYQDDEEDDEDMATDAPALPQDGMEGLDHSGQREPTEAAPSEYPQSEMFVDPSPEEEAEQIAEYRKQRKTEAEEDLEFPDEIELHPHMLARERLARYRGLKSLRSSHWETSEDRGHEPEEWYRLLDVPNYKGVRSQVAREALVGGVKPGTLVDIHLRNVPLSLQKTYSPSEPLAVYSLLRHEHKRTVANVSMTLSTDYPNPIKAKEELIMQCGPRRIVINPVFSAMGNSPNNVHKFDRFLHPGATTMATFIGPLTWGSVPILFFKKKSAGATDGDQAPSANGDEDKEMAVDGEGEGESDDANVPLELIGTGTAQAPDRSRVVAKRVILTGHPFKINKKVVTIRYMFFNTEDVAWFKAMPLWTRRGRSGFIKESLGTHGYFKATFDGPINPQDAVGISLYKRVFPRSAKPFHPEMLEQ
ncbi:DUF663-domain-containing protein [Xylona heveae TC161]|uniref:DUF663-domain-containing protein n=1 Tax=Xylona heveae (strain CBS 132557 / TC161) TaxID=1328760 RepID=A0A165A2H0_XYLHT|nr:DUF663-domain-containing protein [Xylona heveae TC161]KZF19861.1 DUF663-domain-containing protein [Xylona heveae TC161]